MKINTQKGTFVIATHPKGFLDCNYCVGGTITAAMKFPNAHEAFKCILEADEIFKDDDVINFNILQIII